MKFHHLFIPKARQLTFATDITIHALDHVPMLTGRFYAKLKLPSLHNPSPSTSASSPRAPLRDHAVTWNWRYCFDADLTKDEHGVLDPWPFLLVIKLDRSHDLRTLGNSAGSSPTERIGSLHLDLAHFAGAHSVTTRKFLLQDTRINSTVKVTIVMTLKYGDPLFKVPELPSDLQIDISRFTKSIIPTHPHPTLDLKPSDPDVLAASMPSYSTSDPSSFHPARVFGGVSAPSLSGSNSSTAQSDSSLLAPPLSVTSSIPHRSRPQSTQRLASGTSPASSLLPSPLSLGSHSTPTRMPITMNSFPRPVYIPLHGTFPHLPAADTRLASTLVDDLFARVLSQISASSSKSHSSMSSSTSVTSSPTKSTNTRGDHSHRPGVFHYRTLSADGPSSMTVIRTTPPPPLVRLSPDRCN